MKLAKIVHVSDLRDRVPVRLKAADYHICVVRNGADVYAFPNRCPHTGARLDGARVRRTVITCPHHLAQFDLCSGAVLSHPVEGLNPEQTGPLPLYKVDIDDGWVTVDTEPADWSIEESR